MAESIGRLPPTPTDHNAAKQPMTVKFGEPVEPRPKIAVMPIVKLEAQRRPKISQPKPQKLAPNSRPMFWARESSGGWRWLNSRDTGFRISEVTLDRSAQFHDIVNSLLHRPKIVAGPSKSNHDEELPLIPAHSCSEVFVI
jgi:hypothetical protein